ncbi:MAG: ABC transporter substrate-binding protein [Fervidicoccaceae archaeon]
MKASSRTLFIIMVVALIIVVTSMYSLEKPSIKGNVSLGVEFNAHATPFWVLLEDDSFEKNGINVTRVMKFKSGMEVAAAVARGEIVMGQACLGPILMMIDQGIPVKIVGKIHDGGFALVVNPTEIHSLEDLNGKPIYTPGPGTQSYFLALFIQDKYNIKFSEIKSMPPQEILAGLTSGSIKAAMLPKPYPEVAESNGLRILLEDSEAWPDMPGSFIFVRADYLESNPEVVKAVLKIVEEKVQEIERDPSRAIAAVASQLGVSASVAQKTIQSIQWNTTIDIQQIQRFIDFAYSRQIIKNHYDAQSLVVKVNG